MITVYDVALVSYEIEQVTSPAPDGCYDCIAEKVHKEFENVREEDLLARIKECFLASETGWETVRITECKWGGQSE